MVRSNGDQVTIRRAGAPAVDYGPIAARLTSFANEELTANMQEGSRKVIMLADDVAASGLPLPIRAKQDRMMIGARALVIQSVDDTTRRVGGVLIAYELEVTG